jgi:hypothetical protein
MVSIACTGIWPPHFWCIVLAARCRRAAAIGGASTAGAQRLCRRPRITGTRTCRRAVGCAAGSKVVTGNAAGASIAVGTLPAGLWPQLYVLAGYIGVVIYAAVIETSRQCIAQVLPASVPELSRTDAEATEYPPLVRALQAQQQLALEWFSRLPAEATGGASFEGFHWALMVRHDKGTPFAMRMRTALMISQS